MQVAGNGRVTGNGQERAPLALITGASSGIGYEAARLLAARGMRTLLLGRRLERLETLAAELSIHAPSTPVAADLCDPACVDQIIKPLLEEHGPIDVLLNNAGIGQYSTFLDQTEAEHRRLFEVNYFSAIALIRAVLPGMIKRNRGHVINITSMSARMGPWGHSGYAASKAAMTCLTECLAAEHMDDKLHFSHVSPGIVDTPFFDSPCFAPVAERLVRRHGISAQRVARQIVRLLDHPRLEVLVPGHYRLFDWIIALTPTLAHRMVQRQSRPR